ncbi:MAG TPA: glycosyl hydrolase family 18 protein [Terriglobales bacterium]|jgi:chitodextrinase|nr:glycosyl hydrolase family 18 protein [Terriglobales bacterium]
MKRTPLIIVSTCILLLLLLLPLASSAQTSAQAPSAGSGCGPAWNPTTVYSAPGNLVSRNGVNYKNNWWTLGDDPATHSGPAGSGQPWTSVGVCSSCSTLPSVPTGLSASGTTGSSTNLSWHASTAASNCTVTGYTVFRNGNSVGTAGGTSFTVTGLAAQTTYSFTVAAVDPAGSSGRSAAVNVTTGKGGGGGGGGGSKVFAPYDDISLAVGEQVVSMAQQAGLKAITLAFMVDGGCTAVWGGLGGTTFPNGTPVATAISQLQSNGVTVYIAFGGANGSVLSSCGNAGSAQAMYQAVVNTYHPAGLDFDIEGGVNASVLMQALAGLKRANGNLTISLTLPVLSSGLVTAGTDLLAAAHQAGFNPDVVNVMAMDMGSANDNGGNMGLSATQAASNTHNQVMAAGLSSSIGVTPMIGVNDTNTEIFRFSDVNTLLNFTASNSYITRLAFWSLARDNGSCPNQGFASPVCSGVSQNTFQFSQSFEAFH